MIDCYNSVCSLPVLAINQLIKSFIIFLMSSVSSQSLEDQSELLPCIVMALRGKFSVKKILSMIGPRDPILAHVTDEGSLNALYGEQISKRRGDLSVPTGEYQFNLLCLFFANLLRSFQVLAFRLKLA